MSKGIIIKHLARGKYLVKCELDMTAINERIKALDAQIEKSNHLINNELQTAINIARQELNAINGDDKSAIEKSVVARHKLDNALSALASEKLTRQNAIDEKGKLTRIDDSVNKELWLADLNTELAAGTEVGIIDFYQMRENSTSNRQLILPAHIDTKPECSYLPIRDGRLVPSEILSTYQWFYAFCAGAALERFAPRYRKGVITEIHANGRCDVIVDSNYTQIIPATAKSLTGKETQLKNVPVRYLACNALAFKKHDRVVLEYPLKNIHKSLSNQFTSQKTALEKSKTTAQEKINALQTKIDAKKAEINIAQIEIDNINADIKAGNNDSGATALQNEIDILEDEIVILHNQIIEQNEIKIDFENEANSLQNDIDNLNRQLTTLQQQLQDLINNNAPANEITAKEIEIANVLYSINITTTDRNTALSNRATAQSLEDNYTAQKIEKMNTLAEKRLALQPLLNRENYNKEQLKIKLDEQVTLNLKLTSLENEQFIIKLNSADIDRQIMQLTELIAQEHARFERLKKYTDTRPQEITIIGFESNPRPCGVSLTVMKQPYNDNAAADPAGKYPDITKPPFQSNDYRWLYQTATQFIKLKNLYAGGVQQRALLYADGINHSNLTKYPISEGGSWRGKLLDTDLQESAVSWAYFDDENIAGHYDQDEKAYYFAYHINNAFKQYSVYIGGKWGQLPRFLQNGYAHSVAGMCLYSPKKAELAKLKKLQNELIILIANNAAEHEIIAKQLEISNQQKLINEQTNKYGLAVIYRPQLKHSKSVYIVKYSVTKSDNEKLIFNGIYDFEISLASDSYVYNKATINDAYIPQTDLYREITGFSNDGLHFLVASVNPDDNKFYIERVKLSADYSYSQYSVEFSDDSTNFSTVTGKIGYPRYSHHVTTDYDRFIWTTGRDSSLKIYELKPNSSYSLVKSDLITNLHEDAYTFITFVSTRLKIYQYVEALIINPTINEYKNTVFTKIDDDIYTDALYVSKAGGHVLNWINENEHTYQEQPLETYAPRYMAIPYTDSVLILGASINNPYQYLGNKNAGKTMLIGFKTTGNNVSNYSLKYIEPAIDLSFSPENLEAATVSQTALIHLPF